MSDSYRHHATMTPADAEGGYQMPRLLVNDGAVRVSHTGDGRMITEHMNDAQAVGGPVQPSSRGSQVDPLAARTAGGMPISLHALQPDGRVVVGGIETRADIAERMGFIRRAAGGGYEVVGAGQPQTPAPQTQQQQQQQPAADPLPGISPETKGLLSKAEALEGGAVMTAAASLLETGEADPKAIERLAGSLGMEVSAMGERVAAVAEEFRRSAVENIRGDLGSSALAQEVLEWAGESLSKESREAALRHVRGGGADYKALARAWQESLAERDPERILSTKDLPRGYKVTAHPQHGVLVTTPQGQMPWRVAVRAGLIAYRDVR